jgi:8-oxo-dGTP pyrophosphatase MutT (NUDIX family)
LITFYCGNRYNGWTIARVCLELHTDFDIINTLIKKNSPTDGIRYTLPGGALNAGETLHQAVIRECIEEINTPVINKQCCKKIRRNAIVREFL